MFEFTQEPVSHSCLGYPFTGPKTTTFIEGAKIKLRCANPPVVLDVVICNNNSQHA